MLIPVSWSLSCGDGDGCELGKFAWCFFCSMLNCCSSFYGFHLPMTLFGMLYQRFKGHSAVISD